MEALSFRLERHARDLVSKDGAVVSELQDDLRKAAILLKPKASEEYAAERHSKKKLNQRTQLRQLHRAHDSNRRLMEMYMDRNQRLNEQLTRAKQLLYDINRVRSNEAGSWVMRCWGCRFRNWYQTMTGQAYPDYEGRRFPFQGSWPLWK